MRLGYCSASGISIREELNTIPKKDKNPLQPIFEALMNSFEAIKSLKNGKVIICFNVRKDLFTDENGKSETEEYYFKDITISDNGIGFNEEEFNRIYTLRDISKNMNNKGTGRVQFLHYFETTHFNSIYKAVDSSTKYNNCEFTLSKSLPFLKENAFIRVEKNEKSSTKTSGTILTFSKPMDKSDYDYCSRITPEEVKELCIKHYLHYFCQNKLELPSIEIKRVIDDIPSSVFITRNDIPEPDHSESMHVNYSTMKDNKIIPVSKKEEFKVLVFF